MSRSSSDGGSEDEVPYAERPEWADVEPLHYVEGAVPVVAIQYTAEHKDALAYFRAVLLKEERSARALELTAHMIRLNQADYTAWEWRWQCLCALGVELGAEYGFTDPIMTSNAKNYQLWNHRRKCALALGPGAAARELQVAATALDADEKNYHAWAHRQAVVSAFGGELLARELEFAEAMLERDLRNNSAWNQRALCVRHELTTSYAATPGGASSSQGREFLAGVLERELEFTESMLQRAPRNEAALNYLRGLFALPGSRAHAMGRCEMVYMICKEALMDAPSCPGALDVLSEFYLHQVAIHASAMQRITKAAQTPSISPDPGRALLLSQAHTCALAAARACTTLLNHLLISDPMRTMYWNHRQRDLDALLAATGLQGDAAQPAGPPGAPHA